AEREEGHVGDAVRGELVDEAVVVAVGEVVHVLHALDPGDGPRLGHLLRRGVADAQMPDEALPLQFHERFERFGDRAGHGPLGVAEPEVDQVERFDAEGLEVLVDGAAQVLGPPGRGPAAVRVPVGADLGRDAQRFGVRVERFADQPVGDVRTVGVAGVDVRDAEVDGLAQDGDRALAVGRGSHDSGTGELHGAVAETGDGQVAEIPGAAGEPRSGCVHVLAFLSGAEAMPRGSAHQSGRDTLQWEVGTWKCVTPREEWTMTTMTAAQKRARAKAEYDAFLAACPSRQLLDRISDKWATLILCALNSGDSHRPGTEGPLEPKGMRYSELSRRVAGVSQK